MSNEQRLRLFLLRVPCVLVGCALENDPGCRRCNSGLYDPDFIQVGWLDPVFRLYWNARRLVRKIGRKKCNACGKRYWRGGYNEWLCSEECFDGWLPF